MSRGQWRHKARAQEKGGGVRSCRLGVGFSNERKTLAQTINIINPNVNSMSTTVVYLQDPAHPEPPERPLPPSASRPPAHFLL